MISTKHNSITPLFISAGFKKSLLMTIAVLGLNFLMTAQATLSVQGILKKSNGVALDDGTYTIRVNIYAVDGTPSGVLWYEIIDDVELNGGIYSVILGNNPGTPLNLAFDQDYEMGVQIGSQEMTPKIRLTSAPYALALRGSSNQFPSAGQVLADEIKLADGVIASGGAPGVNNANKNGYTFHNGGDNDGGLFSTADGEVSIYVNSSEKMEVKDAKTTFTNVVEAPSMGTNGVNLYNDGTINYSTTSGGSFSAWRLADVDDLGSHDGWQSYSPNGQNTGWNNASPAGDPCLCNGGTFVGNILQPSANNQVLKKQFNIPGSWSQMKVKFRYYFFDTWGWGGGDMAFAGFANNASGSTFKVAWSFLGNWLQSNGNFNNTTAVNAVQIGGQGDSDYYMDVEMSARRDGSSSSFWVFIGSALDEGTTNETYAVGPIEVWVR